LLALSAAPLGVGQGKLYDNAVSGDSRTASLSGGRTSPFKEEFFTIQPQPVFKNISPHAILEQLESFHGSLKPIFEHARYKMSMRHSHFISCKESPVRK